MPGFCLDIGAPRSVFGFKAMTEALAVAGTPNKHVRRSTDSLRFGDVSVLSRRQISIPVATPSNALPIIVDLKLLTWMFLHCSEWMFWTVKDSWPTPALADLPSASHTEMTTGTKCTSTSGSLKPVVLKADTRSLTWTWERPYSSRVPSSKNSTSNSTILLRRSFSMSSSMPVPSAQPLVHLIS